MSRNDYHARRLARKRRSKSGEDALGALIGLLWLLILPFWWMLKLMFWIVFWPIKLFKKKK